MNKTILIIAFHFPPNATSSGMQRALKVVRYLREDGWRPIVLTVDARAYSETNTSQLEEIPEDVLVHRAFGLNTARHLAIRGRYPGFLAWPDPWASWWPAAVWAGRRLIRRHQPCAIWSTFPITTTNLVAMHLAKWSRLPWISDLRDPITLDGYPVDPMRFRCARWIENKTVDLATHIVFTAEYTRRIYAERYPGLDEKSVVIPNGYDEHNFPNRTGQERVSKERLTLVHSGALQPKGRNPRTFFEALNKLKEEARISSSSLRIVFRACGFERQYREMAEHSDVADLVEFEGYLPYDQAINEMVDADGLLVFQGSIYNHAVPAKVYEYFFARRPIFGVLDKSGETQRVLQDAGIDSTASIDDAEEIANLLRTFIERLRDNSYFLPARSVIESFSRRRQTQKLSALLRQVVSD